MTTFRTRQQIGLRPPNPAKLSRRSPDDLANYRGFTIHHTGYGGTLWHIDPLARLRGIQAYHMDTLGYGDIAYEGAFDADANTYALRDHQWVGAHALGTKRGGSIPNRLTDGLVFLEDARGWTAGASAALAWWTDLFRWTNHNNPPAIWAHEWWSLTECPGPYVINVVRFVGGTA